MQINKSGLSITWPKIEQESAGLIITFEPSPWMDGRQVVVGEMIEGPLGGTATLDKMRKSVNMYNGISASNFRIEASG